MTDTEDEWAEAVQAHREEKERVFESPAETPLSEAARSQFDGLEFFPIDPAYRLTGRLEQFDEPREVELEATRGPPMSFAHVGQLGVEIEGDLTVLEVYQATGVDTLLLPFRDRTNGQETWANGRYVNLPAPEETGRVEVPVDFNLAYHPLCVYDQAVRSAKPPAENNFEVPIRAGERR